MQSALNMAEAWGAEVEYDILSILNCIMSHTDSPNIVLQEWLSQCVNKPQFLLGNNSPWLFQAPKYWHRVIFMQHSLQMKPEGFDPEDSTQKLKEIIPPKPPHAPWQWTQVEIIIIIYIALSY